MRTSSGQALSGAKDESMEAASLIARGVSFYDNGNLEGAVLCYQQALQLDPKSYEAYNNLGNLFASLGDRQTAFTFLQAAANLNPEASSIHNNLGNIYLAEKRIEEAIASYTQAITLQPTSASFHNHLGNALRLNGRYSEAAEHLETALSLRPGYAEALVNVGFLHYEQQQLEEAEGYYRQAIIAKPDFALAHTCLGQMLLRRGEFTAGWAEQEWRWRWKDFPSPKRNFQCPQWRGEDIVGAKILVHAEQGVGDAIQFLRYIPMLIERGASIVLEVHPELRRLALTLDGVAQTISRGGPLPDSDWHCPLMSLPLAFATVRETIPSRVPYLYPTSEHVGWLEQSPGKSLRVGLVWAGNPDNQVDRKRSIALSAFAPLFQIEGVSIYSLQRGPASEEIPSSHLPFTAVIPQEGDFAVTAAAIVHLDLIVAVDTAVAHLAGALAKPVWILLPRVADWRWLTDRSDSPWYPSARLFRQRSAGQWDEVIVEICEELSHLLH